MRFGVVRLRLNGGTESFYGLVKISLLPQGNPERVVNVCLVRIEGSGLLEFNDCLGQTIFQFQGQPQIVVQSCVIKGALQCGLELCNRGIEIAFL